MYSKICLICIIIIKALKEFKTTYNLKEDKHAEFINFFDPFSVYFVMPKFNATAVDEDAKKFEQYRQAIKKEFNIDIAKFKEKTQRWLKQMAKK